MRLTGLCASQLCQAMENGMNLQAELPLLAEQLMLPAPCAALRAWDSVLQQQHQVVDRSERPV